MTRRRLVLLAALPILALLTFVAASPFDPASGVPSESGTGDRATNVHAQQMLDRGRSTFRYATFGDEAFWGDTLQIHKAIEGSKMGRCGARR